MRGLSPASLMLPALLACFGRLVSAQVLPQESCPLPDPLEFTVLLPHPSDCSRFFSCSNGVPIELHCPGGLHFNEDLKVCDWPHRANCVKPEECIGEDLDNDLNKTLSGKAAILFVLDDSDSVTEKNFIKTKNFVKDVVQKYPLSENRSAGVITFGLTAQAQIHLNLDSTSDFLDEVENISYIGGANNSILAALQLAIYEINSYNVHNPTVVVLITDGMSETDGTPAADKIKEAGNPIFAIGINSDPDLAHLEALASTGENGIKHFFHLRSYEALEEIGEYLNPPAGSSGPNNNTKCSKE